MADEKGKKDELEFEIEVETEQAPLEVEPATNTTYNVLDKKEDKKKDEEPPVRTIKDGETEVEVVDDRPAHDRGRKPAKDPIPEPTEEELREYSQNVQQRMKDLNKKFHDQRRAAEQAQREKQELEAYARRMMEENKRLQSGAARSRNSMIEQAKKAAQADVAAAERESADAYADGDPAKIAAANRKLTEAVGRQQRVAAMRPNPLQRSETDVQMSERVAPNQQQPNGQPRPQQPPVDEKAQKWAEENSWFGTDEEMTAFALGYHNKMVTKEGVDPRSDEYYNRMNARMREVFPKEFDFSRGGNSNETPVKTEDEPASVVAPVRRSAAPKRVRLTESQVAIAKQLNVPLEEYAKQAANAEIQERR